MIRWTSTFGGGWRAEAGDFKMNIYWSSNKGENWKVRVAGLQLLGSFETLEEAQDAAVVALRVKLKKGLAALPKVKR